MHWKPVLVVVALCAFVGCGDDGDEGSAPSSSAPGASAPGGAFPVTIEHAFGATEITEAPERIVTVGLTEQDVVLALGHTPVGVTDWYGDQPHATWPWAQDELGDATPEVLHATDGFEYEKIASLRPDLIVGTNAGVEQESYDRLSRIAPTIAHAKGAEGYFSHWRDQTRTIGQALGQQDEAEALIDGIDERFAEAAADHPEFAGKQVIFLQNAFYEGEAIAYQDGLSTQFLTDLGFEIPDVLDEYVREAEGSQAFIPLERLSVLDEADLLVWATEKEEDVAKLEEQPLYNQLRAVRDGDQVFTDGLSAGAIYFTTVLSLPLVLDKVVPALAQAVAGDGPATAEAIPEGAAGG